MCVSSLASQLLPLAPAEAGAGAAELAAVPGAAVDGGQDAADADELGVRTHENELPRAAPPAARRALLLRYRYVQLRHVVSFRLSRMARRKAASPAVVFRRRLACLYGNARRGRRKGSVLLRLRLPVRTITSLPEGRRCVEV